MDDNQLRSLWNTTNQKLEASLVVNQQNALEITKLKVIHFLSLMKPAKIFTIIAGILWVLLGAWLLISMAENGLKNLSMYFFFSAFFQLFLTAIALAVYVYQLILIYRVDISDSILRAQQKISKLKRSTLWITRLLILQLPLWVTMFMSDRMLNGMSNTGLFLIWGMVIVFSVIAAWLFVNINYQNRNRRWFRILFSGREWEALMKSMDLLEQVEEYKADN